MEQLSSLDASFIEAETPNLPMHISSVSIYDPSTAPQGKVRFKDIMQLYEDAIYEIPMLRQRLVEVTILARRQRGRRTRLRRLEISMSSINAIGAKPPQAVHRFRPTKIP